MRKNRENYRKGSDDAKESQGFFYLYPQVSDPQ